MTIIYVNGKPRECNVTEYHNKARPIEPEPDLFDIISGQPVFTAISVAYSVIRCLDGRGFRESYLLDAAIGACVDYALAKRNYIEEL